MPQVITLFAYFLLLCIIGINITKSYKEEKILNASIFFQVAFITYYVLIPMITIVIVEFTPNNLDKSLLRASQAESSSYYYACLYSYISYIVFLLSYKVISSKKKRIEINRTKQVEHLNEVDHSKNAKKYNKALKWGIVTLSMGIFAELIISVNLGGIFSAIAMGDKLRAFGVDIGNYIPQNRLFSVVLMVSSLASTYFFVYAYRIKKSVFLVIMLVLSILASIFYLMINAGRLGVLLFIMTFFIDFAFRKFKRPFLFVFISMAISMFLLAILDDLFFYMSYGYVKDSSTSIYSLVNEFAFPYVNLLNIQDINNMYGLRLGIDYVTWIINIVPSSILGIFGLGKVTTGYHYITDYFLGSSASGGIPTDILTLGMRQFGVAGLLLQSAFLGVICKYFDKIINLVHSNQFYFMTLRISSMMFIIVPYADLDSFVRNRYDMILVLIFAIMISKQVATKKKDIEFNG